MTPIKTGNRLITSTVISKRCCKAGKYGINSFINSPNKAFGINATTMPMLIPFNNLPKKSFIIIIPNLLCIGDYYREDSKKSRSEEHTSELQSRGHLVCRLLLEKKKIEQQIGT